MSKSAIAIAPLDGLVTLPEIKNETVRGYAPGSPEREEISAALRQMTNTRQDLPSVIAGKAVRTGRIELAVMPHNHKHILADVHLAGSEQVRAAISAANEAQQDWAASAWTDRAAVFLKAAHILATKRRNELNAATMLGQSKTVHQAEIDSAAELIDFWNFNVAFMHRLYQEQPLSEPASGIWNRSDYRPLEGFVFAATPFNFTAIAGNLPSAPALMGNTVVWKPSAGAKLSAYIIMDILREAGLPDGVINLVYGDAGDVAKIVLEDPTLAGVHFTGSTDVFNSVLRTVGERAGTYKGYPRIVGETGGKNFILAHASADVESLATATIRGGYEYQGQKCSAASRLFIPETLWPSLKARLCDEMATIGVGDVCDFTNFMGAVIDERAWMRHSAILERVRSSLDTSIIAGGKTWNVPGYFVEPTLLLTTDPNSELMRDEIFGPIVTAYVYPDKRYGEMIDLIDKGSRYGLTGAVFAKDRQAIVQASIGLRYAAGNFYINDKPTGAVVGQQPFGGARASGTNDKAGSMWNLARWVSARTVKETFSPPTDYRYPFMSNRS